MEKETVFISVFCSTPYSVENKVSKMVHFLDFLKEMNENFADWHVFTSVTKKFVQQKMVNLLLSFPMKFNLKT